MVVSDLSILHDIYLTAKKEKHFLLAFARLTKDIKLFWLSFSFFLRLVHKTSVPRNCFDLYDLEKGLGFKFPSKTITWCIICETHFGVKQVGIPVCHFVICPANPNLKVPINISYEAAKKYGVISHRRLNEYFLESEASAFRFYFRIK